MGISARERGIGFRQTWQDMAGSRAVNTVYTNTTGRPISVSVVGTLTTTGGALEVAVDGVVVGKVSGSQVGEVLNCSFIVPPGGTYAVAANVALLTYNYWRELR